MICSLPVAIHIFHWYGLKLHFYTLERFCRSFHIIYWNIIDEFLPCLNYMEVGQLPWGVALTVLSWSPITYALDREYIDLIGPSVTIMDMIGLNYLTVFWMRDFEYAPLQRHDINHSIIEMGLYVWLFPVKIIHFEVVFTIGDKFGILCPTIDDWYWNVPRPAHYIPAGAISLIPSIPKCLLHRNHHYHYQLQSPVC